MSNTSTDARLAELYAELRTWVATHDYHVRAAVDLLIQHDYWLRNGRFTRVAVMPASDGRYIAWTKARAAFDAGEFDRSSSTELAVLDLAISLGENRFQLSKMGDFNAAIMVRAFASAAAVQEAADAITLAER